jgi:ABC-2 type transport system ATP-binding protein
VTLAIDVQDLSKKFGTLQAVDHVSIQIEQGHITGFLGPNGSGKTTTLRMLCGLLTPDSGSGQVLGLDFPREAEAIKRQTGYMTQRFSLYEDLTIEENLTFIARVYGLDRINGRVDETLEKLGLQHRRKQLAGQLSGGWKQRLALAASVMHEPKLLLLDEPTAGVDPQARRDFWDEIHRLADGGMTVLVSTHYMDEAERCHEIAYIFNGELIARGTVDAVIANSHLTTWTLSTANGENLSRLSAEISAKPGVVMVAPFGQTLHVSGTDRKALEAAIAPFRRDPYKWTEVAPTLEDVFINLMRVEGAKQDEAA